MHPNILSVPEFTIFARGRHGRSEMCADGNRLRQPRATLVMLLVKTLRPSIWGLALVLAGCGDDGGAATSDGSTGATSGPTSGGDATGSDGDATAATTDQPGEDTTAGSDGGTESESDSDTDGPPPCEAEGFDATSTEWTLPAVGGQTLNDMAGVEDCPDVTNGFRYATTDLDGDGGPDLVLTRDCEGSGSATDH